MKKIFFVGLLLVATSIRFGQKVEIKDGIASVDGVAWLKWDRRVGSEISVSGINSTQEEIYIMYLDYSDPKKVTSSNPEGKVRWIELNFLTLKKKCEISTRGHDGIVKFLFENKVYVDNVLNAENVDIIVQKYGMRFSEARPGGNVNIYINE